MIDDRKLYSYYVLLYYYSIMSSIIVLYVFSKIMSSATKVLLPKHIIPILENPCSQGGS